MAKRKGKARKPKRLPRKPTKKQRKKQPARTRARKPLPRKPIKRKAPRRPAPVRMAPAPLLGELSVGPSLLDFIRYTIQLISTPTVPTPTERWTPPTGVTEEFGFNLREVGTLDPNRFVGKGEATMTVTVTRFADGVPVPIERVVTFDTGEDDDDFWRNYHEALRDAIDETWEEFHEEYPDYEREDGSDSAAVSVGAIAA